MAHSKKKQYQIVISGVGGQGVLFVTRLLAEAAVRKELPVFTSETHGMAQRGGTVISHLKVGPCSSPLIRPGKADGIIALNGEGLEPHGGYVMPGGWAVVNTNISPDPYLNLSMCCIDADKMARALYSPKSMNLIMLGFALSDHFADRLEKRPFYCTTDDISEVLDNRFHGNEKQFKTTVQALETGAKVTAGCSCSQK